MCSLTWIWTRPWPVDKRLAAARNVSFIQCVGSRDDNRPYCSKICCTHSLKSALAVKKMNPKKKVSILYRDIRAYGFREDLYKQAREAGILFIRYEPENPPEGRNNADNQLLLDVTDHVLRMPVRLRPDLLVLATGVVPNANRELFEMFKVPVNADGFLVEAHAKLRPVEFSSEGIYLAGLAHYPKPLEEASPRPRPPPPVP
jgi:heterodisulfide reductase subunit A-like polyferredoxin